MWLKHPKFQELMGRRLTREDPENGYQRTKLSFLQIFLTGPVRHQSWYLDSGCLQHIKQERHMFLELELKPGGVVGLRGNQKEVYKLKSPFYGLKQASKAWLARHSDLLLKDKITGRIFGILVVSFYIDDIIFGSANPSLCQECAKINASRT